MAEREELTIWRVLGTGSAAPVLLDGQCTMYLSIIPSCDQSALSSVSIYHSIPLHQHVVVASQPSLTGPPTLLIAFSPWMADPRRKMTA